VASASNSSLADVTSRTVNRPVSPVALQGATLSPEGAPIAFQQVSTSLTPFHNPQPAPGVTLSSFCDDLPGERVVDSQVDMFLSRRGGFGRAAAAGALRPGQGSRMSKQGGRRV
jgi:hypothetical protein